MASVFVCLRGLLFIYYKGEGMTEVQPATISIDHRGEVSINGFQIMTGDGGPAIVVTDTQITIDRTRVRGMTQDEF